MLGTYIPKPKEGIRYAIGDIHGCFETFRTLVEDKIRLTKNDQLFLLGDYIDRGPKSKQVIDYILSLSASGYAVYPLRGNHEQMRIDRHLIDILPTYSKFLNSLLHYYETEGFILVHETLNFEAEDPFEDSYSMLWGKDTEPDLLFLNGRKIVHGHTIRSLTKIQDAVSEGDILIPLDNGCYKALNGSSIAFGNLCGLNLDSFELIVQKNMDC